MTEHTPEQIRFFLQSYISKKQGPDSKPSSAALQDDCDMLLSGLIDSMGLLELMSAIQNHCRREIDFEGLDPEQLTVVGPLCRYVSDQMAKAEA
jgi:acyl carrier protein